MASTPPSPTPNAWNTVFEPYAMEIGFLAREWNDMQERMCGLFCITTRLQIDGAGSAIWYSVQKDISQRKMLKVAAEVVFEKHADLLTELAWLISEADKVGYRRDDAIHAPLSMVIGDPLHFTARYFHGNPKAVKLKGKDLLAEFRWYRGCASSLGRYASQLGNYVAVWRDQPVGAPLPPLPGRPVLPTLGQKKKDQEGSRKVPANARPRREDAQ